MQGKQRVPFDIVQGETGYDQLLRKWEGCAGRRRSIDSIVVGAARVAGIDGNKIWLRDGALRSMHRTPGRKGDPLVRSPGIAGGGEARDDDRGAVHRSDASTAKGVDRAGRAAVRLLPVREDYERSGFAGGDSKTYR